MEILTLLIIFIVVGILTTIVIELFSLGRLLNDRQIDEYLKLNPPSHINSLNNEIISLNNGFFIAKQAVSILGKYYIVSLGIVPRWSKYNKIIDKLYITLPNFYDKDEQK